MLIFKSNRVKNRILINEFRRLSSANIEKKAENVQNIFGYEFKNKELIYSAINLPQKKRSSRLVQRKNGLSFAKLALQGDNALHSYLTYRLMKTPNSDNRIVALKRQAYSTNNFFGHLTVKHGIHGELAFESCQIKKIVSNYEYFHSIFSPDVYILQDTRPSVYSTNFPHFQTRPPKVLADTFEAIAGAIYIDLEFNLSTFSEVYAKIFEPYLLNQARMLLSANREFSLLTNKSDFRLDFQTVTFHSLAHPFYRSSLTRANSLACIGHGTCKKAAEKSAFINFLRSLKTYKNSVLV